jgi:nucleoside-diphosphate-sugar epimerase
MKIFLAGATGAIGRRLVPLLVRDGHSIVATTRHAGKLDSLRSAGAEPIVLDALDRDAVMKAVLAARPDVIVHQLTALAGVRNFKKVDQELAVTNRLRTEGTQYLLDAARAAGVRRFVAQSYTGWPNVREGGPVKTEDDPLDPHPPKAMTETLEAIRRLESMVAGATGLVGIVLRYGAFYGPGTSVAIGGDIVEMLRGRKFPLIGNGAGVWSFIHIDDAAEATRVAIQQGPAGIYNIVDDEPVAAAVWLPELSRSVGAKPPFHVPVWLGRLAAGEVGVSMMTRVRGSSNAKAKRVLGWRPGYASWRDGFRRGLAPAY